MVYKIDLSVYETQLNNLNDSWITQYRIDNPSDNITQKYCDSFIFGGFGYVVKDSVTEQYVTEFVGVVDDFPYWHEPEKTIQVKQSNEDCLAMLDEYPEVGVFRKENNIITYREKGFVYVYVNTLLPEHRTLLEQYNAQINEA